MNFKWAIGAVFAVLAATLVLPGVASAHHPIIDGTSDCNNDGTWRVDFTVTNSENEPEDVSFFGSVGDPYISSGRDMQVEQVVSEYEVEGIQEDDIIQDDSSQSGSINDIPNDDEKTYLYVEGEWRYLDIEPNSAPQYREVIEDDFEKFHAPDFDPCKTSVCTDGQNGVETFIDFSNPTNDCDPVRLCVDGESMTVTEHEAAQLDGENGSCAPGDDPPPPPPSSDPEPEELVEEVEEVVIEEVAVAEVSPVVEEVVALPAAGYGTTGSAGIAWVAILGLTLIGIGGGATALIGRRG